LVVEVVGVGVEVVVGEGFGLTGGATKAVVGDVVDASPEPSVVEVCCGCEEEAGPASMTSRLGLP
jgi:hypothetical protein